MASREELLPVEQITREAVARLFDPSEVTIMGKPNNYVPEGYTRELYVAEQRAEAAAIRRGERDDTILVQQAARSREARKAAGYYRAHAQAQEGGDA